MQNKYLTPEEFQNKFELGEKLEFSVESPFESISVSPEKTLFFARHWDTDIVMTGATGTAYICRIGDAQCRFDFDVLSFRLNENSVPEVFHVYTDYHHTNEIPQFMKEQMPDDIKDRVEDYLKNGKLNK